MIITIDEIKENFKFAAEIMRRLPAVKAQGYFCAWPSYYSPAADTQDIEENWLEPLAYEISAMEEILEWLKLTRVDYRMIIWLRACGIGWKQISSRFKRGRSSVCRDYSLGLEEIRQGLISFETPQFMRQKEAYRLQR